MLNVCYTCYSIAYHENIFNTHQMSLDISTRYFKYFDYNNNSV